MKLSIIILFLLPSLLLPSDFSKISSVNFDLVGVVASGDKIAAYGTKGSVYYSYDDAQSWNVIKPFETGNIVNFFIENDRLIAFLQTGEVSQSFDDGLSWNVTNPINDSVSYVIKGNDDYYVRAKSAIIKLSNNLNISDSYPYIYGGFDITYHYLPYYRRLMTFLDNKLFLIDTYQRYFIVFDKNLNRIDSLDFNEKLLKSECVIRNVINDSKDLIFELHNNSIDSTFIYKLDPDLTELKAILNTSESQEKKGKLFKDNSPNVFSYNIYKDKFYTFNKFRDEDYYGPFYNIFELYSNDSANYKGVIDASVGKSSDAALFNIADFVIANDRITAVSTNNFIVSKKLNSGSTLRVSNLIGSGRNSNLHKISDSNFMLITGIRLYKSTDTTKTFIEIEGDTALFKSYLKLDLKFNHYNQNEKRLLYFAYSARTQDSSLVFITDDFGENFKLKLLDNINFNATQSRYNLINDNDKYIISEYAWQSPPKYMRFDSEFNYIDSKVDTNYKYNFFFGDDFNEYIIIGSSVNSEDNNQYLMNTSDAGDTWSKLRTFSSVIDTVWYNDSTQYYTTFTNHLHYNKSFDYDGKSYVLLVTYNRIDSLYKIEAIDLQTKEFSVIYQSKQETYSNTLVELIDGEYFICKGDSLFTTSNILNYKEWQGQKLPNNGTMMNRIMKSGDDLITYYYDDIHPYDIYRIKWNELSITGITENETEIIPYFYNSAPFPQPTSSYVSTKVYMDNNVTITKESIKIYDINGTQVEKGANVEISGNNWPTTLTWDAVSQPPGVYFIVIDYGGNIKAIKVMKE